MFAHVCRHISCGCKDVAVLWYFHYFSSRRGVVSTINSALFIYHPRMQLLLNHRTQTNGLIRVTSATENTTEPAIFVNTWLLYTWVSCVNCLFVCLTRGLHALECPIWNQHLHKSTSAIDQLCIGVAYHIGTASSGDWIGRGFTDPVPTTYHQELLIIT